MGFKGSSNGRGNCCLNNLNDGVMLLAARFPWMVKTTEQDGWQWMIGGVLRMRHGRFSKTAMKTIVSCNFLSAFIKEGFICGSGRGGS